MKEKMQDLSKEELVQIVAQESKGIPKYFMAQFLFSVIAYGIIIWYWEDHNPLGGFVHSWTIFAILVLLVGQLYAVIAQFDTNKRKLNALIELLRKSNVIKE